jgi:hypothetical protein
VVLDGSGDHAAMSIRSRAGELLGHAFGPLFHGIRSSDRTIALPAGGLSYAQDQDFVRLSNGIDWGAAAGSMTASVPRPRDYAGGAVTVRMFFQFGNDESGTHQFTVTAMTYDSGHNFESYGAQATPSMNAPESLGSVYALSVVIPPGNGWADGDWWFFRFTRQGTFPGDIRLMSVGVDYKAKF